MTLQEAAKWNRRASLLYAAGVWVMLGSLGFYTYMGYDKKLVKKEEEVTEEPYNPNQVVCQTAHTKTVITYKENFVPYTERMHSFIKSFSDGPGASGK